MWTLLMRLPGALLQLALWCGLFLASVCSALVVWEELTSGQRGAWLFAGVCALLLGVLLALNVYRLVLWRRRRSLRPSEELKEERRRIAADLHDGVGAQLVSARALLDVADPAQQRLGQLLEQALLDLRLVVDSMDGMEDSLLPRMARLRHRLQPALTRNGIAVHWEMPEAGPQVDVHGQAAQALVLIAQEALSNVLQHAQATVVQVFLGCEGEGVQAAWHLRVQDNGRGRAQPGTEAGGYGLHSMQARARKVGAQLLLEPAAQGGLCVHAVLPLHTTA